jgi:hypothetical protein
MSDDNHLAERSVKWAEEERRDLNGRQWDGIGMPAGCWGLRWSSCLGWQLYGAPWHEFQRAGCCAL